MKISTRYAAAVAALVAAGQPVDAFWRMSCGIIQTGRVDPVISYGSVSNHVHKISGAATININSTYESLQESDCTSCSIQADKSAYWTPALYFAHTNGSYEEVPNSGMTVYYLGRGANNNGNTTASPFPKGLKMLSGNNFARTQDLTTYTWGNKTYPPRLVSEAVSMVCINYENNTGAQTVNMTNMNCPDGFRAQIQMQSCWDGVNLYLSDQSHVAHLSQIDNGICPPTHPILLPHLFYEVFYSVTGFEGVSGQFIFANGDTTGYGFHGDFLNGWDIPTLETAIAECLIGNEDGVVEDCPAFDASNNDAFSSLCPERQPIWPCEPVHGTIAKLPGCISASGYGATVTAADVTCPGGNVASCNASYAAVSSEPYDGGANYTLLGCYTEATNSRALTTKSFVNTTGMTAEACIAFCGGSTYVGVEYSQECYCGAVLQAGSVPANASQCNMDCTGNRWEICGGSSRLNIFKKIGSASSSTVSISSTTSSKSSTSTTVTISSSAKQSSTVSSTSSTLAATAAATSSKPSTTSTAAASSSSKASSSSTTTSTTSSARVFSTKYPNPLLIGNSTIGVWKNQGCWTDNTGGGRVLVDGGVYGDFMGSAPMTLEMCAAYCGAPKINATFFGIEYHEECYCGKTLQAWSTFATSQDDCSFTCPGNSTEHCGQGNRLNLYSIVSTQTTAASTTKAAAATSNVAAAKTAAAVVASTTKSSASAATTSASPRRRGARRGMY